MRVTLLVGATLLIGAGAGSAQRGTARLTGAVASALNGRPLAGVTVTVPAVNVSIRSDDSGRFVLDSLPAGIQLVRILSIGRQPESYSFRLSSGRTKQIIVLLDGDAIDLPPIVVRRDHAALRWGLAGFFERRRQGFGTFLTREDISRRRPADVTQLLSGAGLQYRCSPFGCSPIRLGVGGQCALQLFLDGIAAPGEYLREIDPDDLVAVEIYTNDFVTPFQFRGGFLVSGAAAHPRGEFACGAVVVWTRDWRSDLDADW